MCRRGMKTLCFGGALRWRSTLPKLMLSFACFVFAISVGLLLLHVVQRGLAGGVDGSCVALGSLLNYFADLFSTLLLICGSRCRFRIPSGATHHWAVDTLQSKLCVLLLSAVSLPVF